MFRNGPRTGTVRGRNRSELAPHVRPRSARCACLVCWSKSRSARRKRGCFPPTSTPFNRPLATQSMTVCLRFRRARANSSNDIKGSCSRARCSFSDSSFAICACSTATCAARPLTAATSSAVRRNGGAPIGITCSTLAAPTLLLFSTSAAPSTAPASAASSAATSSSFATTTHQPAAHLAPALFCCASRLECWSRYATWGRTGCCSRARGDSVSRVKHPSLRLVLLLARPRARVCGWRECPHRSR
jgi:hypothetical protein